MMHSSKPPGTGIAKNCEKPRNVWQSTSAKNGYVIYFVSKCKQVAYSVIFPSLGLIWYFPSLASFFFFILLYMSVCLTALMINSQISQLNFQNHKKDKKKMHHHCSSPYYFEWKVIRGKKLRRASKRDTNLSRISKPNSINILLQVWYYQGLKMKTKPSSLVYKTKFFSCHSLTTS